MKRDKGSIHKLFAFLSLAWMTICIGVFLSVIKAGYVNQYLEDCLMQANLAAMLIDPYRYGTTGELVFADTEKTKTAFEETLKESFGMQENLQKIGIKEEITLLELRLYEVSKTGITEIVYTKAETARNFHYEKDMTVFAPDGTEIISSAIYAKICVPVTVGFGIQVPSVKEHCVDVIVSEGNL